MQMTPSCTCLFPGFKTVSHTHPPVLTKGHHHFQLNFVKTELLDFPVNQPIQCNSDIKIDTLSLAPTEAVQILWVVIDSLCLSQPRKHQAVPNPACHPAAGTMVISELDYCNDLCT